MIAPGIFLLAAQLTDAGAPGAEPAASSLLTALLAGSQHLLHTTYLPSPAIIEGIAVLLFLTLLRGRQARG